MKFSNLQSSAVKEQEKRLEKTKKDIYEADKVGRRYDIRQPSSISTNSHLISTYRTHTLTRHSSPPPTRGQEECNIG
jgi:hypothetical protein